jgi:hypothetical protein
MQYSLQIEQSRIFRLYFLQNIVFNHKFLQGKIFALQDIINITEIRQIVLERMNAKGKCI